MRFIVRLLEKAKRDEYSGKINAHASEKYQEFLDEVPNEIDDHINTAQVKCVIDGIINSLENGDLK